MRVYQCDSCNKVIADPYTVKMKEFYVEIDTEYFTRIKTLVKSKRKIKIQLCDDCYKGLNLIGELVQKRIRSKKQWHLTNIDKNIKDVSPVHTGFQILLIMDCVRYHDYQNAPHGGNFVKCTMHANLMLHTFQRQHSVWSQTVVINTAQERWWCICL